MAPHPAPAPPQVAGLWPEPAVASMGRTTGAGQTGYWVVPSRRRPRLLLPMGVRSADRMLSRHGGGPTAVIGRAAWRVIHRSGLGHRLPVIRLSVSPAPDGIEAYLAGALDQPVQAGVLLGPPRANLKPVLQLFDAQGRTIAFAKLGLTPLTRALLSTEAAALETLQRRTTRTFTAPRLLHSGLWRETPVLVQGALELSQSGRAPVEPPMDVMAEIASIGGISRRSFSRSSFLAAVEPPTAADWHGIDLSALGRLHEALKHVQECAFGSWHGDLGPWNMAVEGRRVEVWDWERFESESPVGLDAAHYRTQICVEAQTAPTVAWSQITDDVARLLARLGLDPTDAALTASAYLLGICARYRHDAVFGPTPRLRRRLQWISATAECALATLEEERR